MKNIIVIFVLFVVLLVSCKTERDKIHDIQSTSEPEISERQMVDLLIDLHFVDAYLGNFQKDFIEASQTRLHLSKDNALKSLYGSVFKKHGISQREFYQALRYYSFHQEELLSIYEKVIDRLNMKKDSVQLAIKKLKEHG